MQKRIAAAMVAYTAAALALGDTAPAWAQSVCTPVQGKITNTFIAGGGTLGVVALAYGPKNSAIKLKCALVGQPQTAPADADVAFIHIISCDDATVTSHGPLHSSIYLYTTGNVFPPSAGVPGQLGTFEEMSIPFPDGPAPTGLFAGAKNGSSLFVQGAFYETGSIDMTFAGQICK